MITPILQIVAALGGALATWWIAKKVNLYWQAWRDKQSTSDQESIRKQTESDAGKANSDSDSLKNIDGR